MVLLTPAIGWFVVLTSILVDRLVVSLCLVTVGWLAWLVDDSQSAALPLQLFLG